MMNKLNSTLYRTIPYTVQRADTFLTRLRGLMFRRTPLQQEGLLIAPCNSIHMCFMTFSIDVVFLDNDHKIVKLVNDLKPWRFLFPVKGARAVLELPYGSINQLSLEVGQFLKL